MEQQWFVPPSDFLACLEPGDREALCARGVERRLARGEFVFQAGSPGENAYILLDGRVKIHQISGLGRETILWFCFPGELFGVAEVPRAGRREVYAQCSADSLILAIPKARFEAFLAASPAAALRVMELLSCRLRTLGDMLMNLTSDDATSRVVKLLFRLCARYGMRMERDIRLQISLTHQEMADMIGVSRQTVSTVLGDLRRRRLLEVENHQIHIVEPEALYDVIRDSGGVRGPVGRGAANPAAARGLARAAD